MRHTSAMSATVMPGAEPWSHSAASPEAPAALVIHGFTGNPGSMRGLAEAFAAAGFHVEMPLLPGHGTTVDEMLTTTWSDWAAAAEAAFERLVARVGGREDLVVVAGLSMGGSLKQRIGADHPGVAGLVCVNPATQPLPADVLSMLEGMAAETPVMPGIGSDIADPDATESAYDGTPIAPLLSFMSDGLASLAQTYAAMAVPLLLFSSAVDHVVEPAQSDFLAEQYGGPLERVPLLRSFHVATQDFDKELIFERSIEFATRVTGAAAAT
jgi:carboxylesterase